MTRGGSQILVNYETNALQIQTLNLRCDISWIHKLKKQRVLSTWCTRS
jgi:hypothetical protein